MALCSLWCKNLLSRKCNFCAQSMSEPPRGQHPSPVSTSARGQHPPLTPGTVSQPGQLIDSRPAVAQPGRLRPQRTCYAINHSVCRRSSCNFLHLCEVCGANHSAWVGTVTLSKLTPWTPLRLFVLEHELSNHPNQAFVKKLINDLCHGCFIGYKGPHFSHSANNLVSAYQHPTTIDATLEKECQLGRILGPFQYPPLPKFQTSGLGLIPKHDGGWRIIYHLSALLCININDFIDRDVYSLSYCTIDDAYDFIN